MKSKRLEKLEETGKSDKLRRFVQKFCNKNYKKVNFHRNKEKKVLVENMLE